jgi:hypothetical protein
VSTGDPYCHVCGSQMLGAHSADCAAMTAAFNRQPLIPIQADPRMEAALRSIEQLEGRLDAALQRIEALERDVAKSRLPNDGWCRCPAHAEPHAHMVNADTCGVCGAKSGDAYTSEGHFYVNDASCPKATR